MRLFKFLRCLVPHVHMFDSYALSARTEKVTGLPGTLYCTVSWRAVIVVTKACACGTLSVREQYGRWRISEELAHEDEACMLDVLEKAMPKQAAEKQPPRLFDCVRDSSGSPLSRTQQEIG